MIYGYANQYICIICNQYFKYMTKKKQNHLSKIIQYLFAYNSFENKIRSLQKKQKELLLTSIKQVEDNKATTVRNSINNMY